MRIVYDCKLRRPGCVLLQAAMGGDPELANRFPAESWLIAPTDAMGCYDVTEEQLDVLLDIAGESA